MILTEPDCLAGKHRLCNGEGWDTHEDVPAPCPCACHITTEESR